MSSPSAFNDKNDESDDDTSLSSSPRISPRLSQSDSTPSKTPRHPGTTNSTWVRRRPAQPQNSPGFRKSYPGCGTKFPEYVSRFRETSGDASSSSSVADGDGTSDPHPIRQRVKRRKRRKRLNTDSSTLDPERAALIEKVVQIEIALLSQKNSGVRKLKEMCASDGGLINDDLRRRVWPKLLNIDMIETEVQPSQEELEAHKFYNQVVLDVNRSLKRFPPGIAEAERPMLQDQLTRLIIRVLAKHPELHYYQGYHDVAITFLLVVGEQLGFHIVEKLSVGPWLRDFMLPTMEKTNYLLHYIYPILDREDPDLHDFLERSEVGTIFALPWLITWFGHVLPHYTDVVRLYDFFMAQPPLMPVYLAAAIVLYKKDSVLSGDCDMASVHGLLSRIPVDAPFEKLLKISRKLYASYPPSDLESEVDRRVKHLEDDAIRRRREVEKRFKSKSASGSSGGGHDALGWTSIRRVLVVAAPVVIGVLMWKYFHTSATASSPNF